MSIKLSQSADLPSNSAPWRKHLSLTQDEVAKRMGVSQPAFAQQETVSKPRKATRKKIAAAFGITANQLEI
ncbi:hypothetical protein PspS34_12185 [Pseudomonas sp. S34]|nr:hypothetical protein PspS34_12185 [Pseudomonas sp. S34]